MSFEHAFTFENESELKQAFAALLMRYGDPFKAALELLPNDVPRALWVAMHWKNDEVVIVAKSKIVDDGDDMAMLPSKYDAALAIWKVFEEAPTTFEKVAAWKEYAAIRGFIDKPNAGVTVNVNENKVMLVTDHGSRDEWQEKMAKQQAALTSGAYINGHVATD